MSYNIDNYFKYLILLQFDINYLQRINERNQKKMFDLEKKKVSKQPMNIEEITKKC